MRRLLIWAFPIASAAAQFVTPVPAVMPAWLVPYPGAAADNKQALNTSVSTYTVSAPAHDVVSHFRTLFASAGLPFRPDAMGFGFEIRVAAPECDLDISIRRWDPGTKVKVTCSPRLAVNARIEAQQAQEKAARAKDDPMKKFDAPVYPQKKSPQPALTWPAWLVRVDGAKLPVERLSGQLKASFTCQPPRENIQAFYASLLESHGYRVTQGLAAVPAQFGSWVLGRASPDGQLGRNAVIRVEIKPAGGNFTVQLSLQ